VTASWDPSNTTRMTEDGGLKVLCSSSGSIRLVENAATSGPYGNLGSQKLSARVQRTEEGETRKVTEGSFHEEWERNLAKALSRLGIAWDGRTACIASLAVHCYTVIERQQARYKLETSGLPIPPALPKLLDALYPVNPLSTDDLVKRFLKMNRGARRH
jgi:hypothetical protein